MKKNNWNVLKLVLYNYSNNKSILYIMKIRRSFKYYFNTKNIINLMKIIYIVVLFITLSFITFNRRKKIRMKAISVFECLLSSDIKDVIYKAIKKYCEDIIISLS